MCIAALSPAELTLNRKSNENINAINPAKTSYGELWHFIIYAVMYMIYRRIKDLREDKDMTQQQIADLLHVNRRTYSAYENGVNSMTPETLCKLADIYNTSVDYLLNRTDIITPYEK